ncbi:unnamed protein product [Symbiodinium sp. KB8]|nr:unnamed protein product [Symbiodinium sp. KB8]
MERTSSALVRYTPVQVDEKLKTLKEQLEREKRSRLEKEVEEKLRPSAAAFERDARAKLEREAMTLECHTNKL